MINQLLEAAEATMDTSCTGGDCNRREFIEEWIPKVANELVDLQKKYDDLRRLHSMTEAQLLEAEAKIKELEDV